ncbi:MAG: hypothetical protein IJT50_14655 [Lentisphaeria bacterium]|nr:hypothetical protein [Lentisphaeria bacterium]
MKKLLLCALLAWSVCSFGSITESRIIPAEWQGRGYSFLPNYPQTLVLQFLGNGKELAADPPAAVLEFPEFVELKSVSTRTGWARQLPVTREKFTENGRNMVRCKVAFSKEYLRKLNPKTYGWRHGFNLNLLAKPGFAGKNADFKFYFEQKGKKIHEKVYKGVILGLPEFPARPLRYFKSGITHITSENLADEKYFRNAVDFWRKFDARPFCSAGWENFSYPAGRNALLSKNFTIQIGTFACRHSTPMFPGTNFKDLGFMVSGKLVRPGVPHFIGSNGKPIGAGICPRYLLSDPEKLFWEVYVKRGFESRLKHFPDCRDLWFDYEPFVSEGVCDDCLKDFAKFAKVAKVPARGDVADGRPLNRKWRQFKAIQHRAILEKFVATVKKHFPGYRLHLCTDTPNPKYMDDWSCTDSSTVVDKVYAFNPMNYTVGLKYFTGVENQKRRLGRTRNFSWVDPAEEDERFHLRYTPEKILQNIIATAALQADGIVFYPSDNLDGRMLRFIARGLRSVGEAEEILFKGAEAPFTWEPLNVSTAKMEDEKGNAVSVSLPDFRKSVRVLAKQKDGVFAVTVLNYAGRELFLKLALPGFAGEGAAEVFDLVSRTRYTGIEGGMVRKGFVLQVPADGALLLRIGGPARPGAAAAVTQGELTRQLQRTLDALKASGAAFENAKQGDASLNWFIFKKSPAIKLTLGQQWIVIDPVAAEVVAWHNGKKTPMGGVTPSLGMVGFFDTRNQKAQEYQLASYKFDKDAASVTFRHVVPKDAGFGEENPLAELVIEKRITLKRGSERTGEIGIETTFRNPGKAAKTFGFRFRNIPVSGWVAPDPPIKLTLDGESVKCGAVYGKPGTKISWHAGNRITPHEGALNAGIEMRWYRYFLSASGTSGFYSWSNGKLMTSEMLFSDRTLAPGAAESFSQTIRFKMK